MKPRPYLKEQSRLIIDGEALREWLSHYNISQATLARTARLCPQHLNDIINGRASGCKSVEAIERSLTKLINAQAVERPATSCDKKGS